MQTLKVHHRHIRTTRTTSSDDDGVLSTDRVQSNCFQSLFQFPQLFISECPHSTPSTVTLLGKSVELYQRESSEIFPHYNLILIIEGRTRDVLTTLPTISRPLMLDLPCTNSTLIIRRAPDAESS